MKKIFLSGTHLQLMQLCLRRHLVAGSVLQAQHQAWRRAMQSTPKEGVVASWTKWRIHFTPAALSTSSLCPSAHVNKEPRTKICMQAQQLAWQPALRWWAC